jgi:hypothetical protein
MFDTDLGLCGAQAGERGLQAGIVGEAGIDQPAELRVAKRILAICLF